MSPTPLALFIVIALVADVVIRRIADTLDLARFRQPPPDSVADLASPEARRRAEDYARARFRADLAASTFSLLVLLLFWFLGAFQALDQGLRTLIDPPILRGVLYILILVGGRWVLRLPFDIHDIFGIETRFGFNRTTPKVFVLDCLKTALLAAVLGGAFLAVVLGVLRYTGAAGWLIAWGAVTIISVAMHYLAPSLILPLFNRFDPLPDGELRQRLEALLRRVDFPAAQLSVVDGSKRSTKANAFFTGFGSKRRIALYDTLVNDHTPEEIEAVLAHEIGHWKHGHVQHRLLFGIVYTGVLLGLLSLVLESPVLHRAFFVTEPSVYTSLIFFSLLYSPADFAMTFVLNAFYRRQEVEADRFVVRAGVTPKALVDALKKLDVRHLSNLNPHPFSVALNDSHPPLVTRIRTLAQPQER